MRRSRVVLLLAVAVAAIIAFWQRDPGTGELVPTAAVVVADSAFDACLECHDNLDASLEAGTVSLIGFAHQQHFSASHDVGCGNCHGLDTHDRTPPLTPTMDECFSCHIGEGLASELPCLRCHDTTTVSPPQSHFTADWVASHGAGALLSVSLCETCHAREAFCTACHGVDIPHQEDWASYPHARMTFEAGIESCTKCHERGPDLGTRDECDACHHPQNTEVAVWRDAHPEVVRSEGGAGCFECHDPDTCVRCHTTGEEDFSADFTRLAEPEGVGGVDE